MDRDKAIEAIENILYSDLNLSEGTKKALTYAIEVLKKVDIERIESILTYMHDMPSEKELREAIEKGRKILPQIWRLAGTLPIGIDEYRDAIATLLLSAQSILDCKRWPKKKAG